MKGFAFLFWGLLVGICAQAQSKDTLEVKRALRQSLNLLQSKPDSALLVARYALEISTQIGYERGQALSFERLAYVHQIQKRFQKAIESYHEARKVWATLRSTENEARVWCSIGGTAYNQSNYVAAYDAYKKALDMESIIKNKGVIYSMHNGQGTACIALGNYQAAIEHFQLAVKYATNEGDKGLSYNNIGVVYDRVKEYDLALEYYLKALEIKKKAKDKNTYASVLNNIAIIYATKNLDDKALEYYKMSLDIREETKDKKGATTVLNNIGNLYQRQKKYDKAEECYLRAVKYAEETGGKRELGFVLTSMAELAYERKDYDKAIEYSEKAIALARELKILRQQDDTCELLFRIHKAKGNTGKALEYFELHKQLTDSLYSIDKSRAIATLEARVMLEKKEQDILNLSKDNELQQRQLEIAEKRAEADRLFRLAREEKNKRRADSLTVLAMEHQLEADKLSAENQRIEAENRRVEADKLRIEAEKKAYKAETQKQREASALQYKMFIGALVGLALVLVLTYFVYRSRQAQKILSGTLSHKTEELQTMNEELRQTQEELFAQHDLIEGQNKILASKNYQITGSITTALAIQTAVLPFEQHIQKMVKDHFVLYQPRDIVSGDFYWIERVGKEVIVVVGDCTGHGVPGAFMSLIAINVLERVVLQQDIVMPAEILCKMHELVQRMLKQEELDNQSGMDVGVVKIGEAGEICFAGAKRPLYYIDANSPTEICVQAGTRKSIGGIQDGTRQFEEVFIYLPEGSTFYLCSDGLADQNNVARKRLKEKPILDTLLKHSHSPMTAQKAAVQHLLDEHMKGTEQRDDILLLGIKI